MQIGKRQGEALKEKERARVKCRRKAAGEQEKDKRRQQTKERM